MKALIAASAVAFLLAGAGGGTAMARPWWRGPGPLAFGPRIRPWAWGGPRGFAFRRAYGGFRGFYGGGYGGGYGGFGGSHQTATGGPVGGTGS